MTPGDIGDFGAAVDYFARAAAAQIEAFGMNADNAHRQSCGLAIAYGDEAFEEVLTRYGIKVPRT